jgi:cytochrome c peroxidase
MKYLSVVSLGAVMFLSACGESEEKKAAEREAKEAASYDAAIKEYLDLFEPLPVQALSADNPLTEAKINLGYHLFYDPRLSKNNTQSCNTCHNLSTFGVDNEATSAGDLGERGNRNSPSVINAALHFRQFWDGRAETVEEQAGMPITNPVEMNIPNKLFLEQRLGGIELYQELFAKAFPEDKNPVSYKNLELAIGAFERTLITPSRFDDYLKGDLTALSLQEKKGMLSFITIGCTQCHTGASLGGNLFQKFGVYDDYWNQTKSITVDEGIYAISKNENEKYMFKVPGLRNIEHTHPYFHDGSVADLGNAVKIMAKTQLNYNISQSETDNIIAFLKTLSGDLPASVKKTPAAIAGL